MPGYSLPDALFANLLAGAVALIPADLGGLWGRVLVRTAEDAARFRNVCWPTGGALRKSRPSRPRS